MYQQYSTVFGINCRSSLDEFKYFKVTSGIVISDIMHDLLGRVLLLETKLMLKVNQICIIISCYKEIDFRENVTLQVIDDNLKFNLKREDNILYMDVCNKPSPLSNIGLSSTESSLKQHGMFVIQ